MLGIVKSLIVIKIVFLVDKILVELIISWDKVHENTDLHVSECLVGSYCTSYFV